MDSFTTERLLLALLDGSGAPDVDRTSIESDGFVALCRRHRVASLVHREIANGGRNWPPGIVEPLRETTRKTLVDNLLLLKALRDVAAALGEEGIGFVLLKGASLLGFLYQEIQLRPMVDLDLLIRGKDWPKVAETLGQRGYRLPSPERERFYQESWYHQLVESPGTPSCYLEFHWNLESVERSRIDTDELIRDAVPFEIEGEQFLRLCDDHLLLHLSIHLAHHFQDPSLHWIEDLRRLLARGSLDWDRIGRVARQWGVANCLAYSLGYLERVHPGTLPPPARRFALSGIRGWILRAFQTSDPTLPHRRLHGSPLRHAVSMALLDRWSDVGRYVALHSAMRLSRLAGRERGEGRGDAQSRGAS
jgi:Uncharacterised nucleotidyltransferase